jgi:hypothetical protein
VFVSSRHNPVNIMGCDQRAGAVMNRHETGRQGERLQPSPHRILPLFAADDYLYHLVKAKRIDNMLACMKQILLGYHYDDTLDRFRPLETIDGPAQQRFSRNLAKLLGNVAAEPDRRSTGHYDRAGLHATEYNRGRNLKKGFYRMSIASP